MAKDRHLTRGYIYRPTPSDLLKQIDETMGTGWRARVISSVLRRFVAGEPMPSPDDVRKDWDKTGQGHSA
jgi:hypothetical protein